MYTQRLYIFLFVAICFSNLLFSQSYNDGPISIDIKLREVQGNFLATDESLLGIGFAPDELVVKIWSRDNLSLYPWTGGACLQDNNFTPTPTGGNSIDFNNTFANFNFNTTVVPQYLDLKIDTWEDDLPSDALAGFCASGNVCDWNDVECCGVYFFGLCVGIETGDDYRCDGDPFYQGLNYRAGPPCQWYSHGYLNGSCGDPTFNGYYKPHIETYWRYTKGNSFSNAINLGSLSSSNALIHFNSNECYTDYYQASPGNDVIYSFKINNPTGVNISLCGVNGAQYDSYLYLVKDTSSTALLENDNFCLNQSELSTALCDTGTYYVVVDAVTSLDLGTFTLVITEDLSSAFVANNLVTDVSCYNGSDGKIESNISGGYSPYTFNWYTSNMTLISSGAANVSVVDSINNLSAGAYILQVIDNNNCEIFDTILVDEPNPMTLVTSQISASCNGYSDGQLNVQVSGGTPPYSYNWNTNPIQNNANAVFVLAGDYLLTVYDDNNCMDTISESVLEPVPVPVSIVSNNNNVCIGGSVSLQASGAITYSWSPSFWLNTSNGPNVTSTPLNSIDYILTGTDNNGCSNTDTVSISVVQSLMMNSTPQSPSVCEEDSIGISVSGATTYSWFPSNGLNNVNSSTVQASPLNSTNYMVIGTDNFGCSDTIYIDVNVLVKPILSLTNNPVICEGDVTSLVASGADSYQWFPSNGLNNTIGSNVSASPLSNTQYSVIGTLNNGCYDTISTVLSVNPLPALTLFPLNIDLCQYDTAMIFVNGADTYIWSPNPGIGSNSDTIFISPNNTSVYTVLGIDNNGCSSTENVNVNVNSIPNIEVFANKTEICIGDNAILTATGGYQYSWHPSNSLSSNIGNSVSASPNYATTYMVTGTDINSCSSYDTISILVNSLPVLSLNTINPTICNGESIIMEVTGAENYIWSPALGLNTTISNIVLASPFQTTNYQIIGTDQNGCSEVINTNIIVNPSPSLITSPNTSTSICEGSSLTIELFGANSYSWSPVVGLDNPLSNIVQASPLSTTIYKIIGTDLNNCIDSIDFELIVGVSPEVIVSPSNAVICEGESITLSAIGANDYQWIPSSNLSSSIGSSVVSYPLSTQTYQIIGTDLLNCKDTSEVVISVIPLPTAEIVSADGVLCSGDSTAIIVELTGNPTWDLVYTVDGTSSQVSSNLSPYIIHSNKGGAYNISYVSDANGCANVGQGSVFIDLLNSPQANIDFFPKNVNMLDPYVNFNNNSIFSNSYLWDFGDNSPNSTDFEISHIYESEGLYQVALVAYNGSCTDTAFLNVDVSPYYALFIPNVFTPNGDGLNDRFSPTGIGIDSYEIFIYNRWGEQVFVSNDIYNTWDGGLAVSGIYSYVINVIDKMGEFHREIGTVLIE